ncbi:MAG: hypothetical protein LH609_23165 [Rudanella sp.]|nr:hypothetical protein [Rudanella sp.]
MTKLLNSPAVLLTLLIAPIAVFFVYFFWLRYDIPWFDEYENIPYFLQRFLNANSFDERLDALLKPNNEHRVLYARLVVYGQYLLTGGISFQGLMLWGNLGLVVIFCLLYKSTQSVHRPVGPPPAFFFLPVSLILLNAQNYLRTCTAIYTLQYLAIIMLVMVTFFVLALNRLGPFVGALGLGTLATFSMGNGILLWPAGAVMLVMRRRWLWLGVWVVFGAVSVWLYFRNYPVQQGNSEGFAYVLQHPLQTLAGFFIFAGSLFDFFPTWTVEKRAVLPLLAGVVVVGVLAWWLAQVVFRRAANHGVASRWVASRSHFETFLTGVALFLLANMALIAVFRIRFYFGMVLHSSYRTYALVLWAVGYLAFLSLQKPQTDTPTGALDRRPQWVMGLWVLFLAINLLTYFTYVPEAIQRRKHMQGLTFNQQHNQIGLGGTRNSALARWIVELDSTMRVRGWHTLPNPAIAPGENQLLEPRPAVVRNRPLRLINQTDYITVESDQAVYQVSMNKGVYVVFWPVTTRGRAYLMFAEPHKPTGLSPFSRPNGWTASMPKALLPPGNYAIGLYTITPETTTLISTGRVVTVD